MALFRKAGVPEALEDSVDVVLCFAVADKQKVELAMVLVGRGRHGVWSELLSKFEVLLSFQGGHRHIQREAITEGKVPPFLPKKISSSDIALNTK